MPTEPPSQSFFVPEDWVLSHRPGRLQALRLSTGEGVTVDGVMADRVVAGDHESATWRVLQQHEPLLGTLRRQLRLHGMTALDRASLLRGAGWRRLFIELTARCNERCVHCYAESSPERQESLGWEEIRAALDDAKALGFSSVQLTGGDPLLSPHCAAAAEHATLIGIPTVEIYTNGLALRGELYKRLRDLRVSLAFSYYSDDASTHDAITQTPGSHARTTRAIQRALEDGLSVRTGTVLVEENVRDGGDVHQQLVQLGVKPSAVSVVHSRAVGRGHAAMPELSAEPKEAAAVEALEARPFGGTAAVSFEGEVFPCIFSRHAPLGSIRAKALRDILTAPEPVAAPGERFFERRRAWADRLSCWECQSRSVMLEGAAHA